MVRPITEFNPAYNMQNSIFNPVQTNNEQTSLFGKLKEDIDRLETKTNQQTLLNAFSPIPTARRLQSLPDTLEENNYPRAGLLVGLAAAGFPGDFREMEFAFKKGLQKNPYQHEMSYFRGTILKGLPKKFEVLQKMDKTLYDTGFGNFIQKTCNVSVDFDDIAKIKGICKNTTLRGYKYTGNFLQRTLGRAMHRIPVIGLYATSALEIPALYNSVAKTKGNIFDKGKAFTKQLVKSVGYIGFTTAAISIAGAITFPCSALLSLAGMAIGSTIGLMASRELNKTVDRA